MAELLSAHDVLHVDGIVLDIGVSSIQLATPSRGFSFQRDGALDMRMGKSGQSAKDVVNEASEKDLADILYAYGEERASRQIAKKIVTARVEKPIETTLELARLVHSVLPMHGGIKTDTATKTFQALRIFVNDELQELERALFAAERMLCSGGRIVVVSFHSLEDGIVKRFFRERSDRAPNLSRHLPVVGSVPPPAFLVEKSSGLKPSAAELEKNPRARSAHLRFAMRTDAAAGTGGAHA